MRTTDSLEEHVSSFYAELKRIRSLIQMIEETDATMFLLDELLKGTNSQDRNLGSVALIKQLNKGAAYGLISTHDLSLGTLTNHLENVANFSFNSEFINGQLTFDYKLCEGLCKSFNASELMAQMGIDIESNPSNHRLDRD
jgi:DNA mismatch repair ATPase MutS